jgi:hypothetical protein
MCRVEEDEIRERIVVLGTRTLSSGGRGGGGGGECCEAAPF